MVRDAPRCFLPERGPEDRRPWLGVADENLDFTPIQVRQTPAGADRLILDGLPDITVEF